MKKIILLSTFLAVTFLVKAQSDTYKAFKIDIGLGYAIPTAGNSGDTKGGGTVTIQPHYRVSDNFALGLRFEAAGLGYIDTALTTNDSKVELLLSFCASAEYYLAKGAFRPFIGVGGGVFTQSATQNNSGTEQLVAGTTRAGFFPEIGLEMGHFRVSADYNVAGGNNDYVAFKIGFFLGGGKK
ncbi:MAG TPA: outer membrane beta-barrel protein [Mucilaginibacter sp.]|jgi:outer membrane protein W